MRHDVKDMINNLSNVHMLETNNNLSVIIVSLQDVISIKVRMCSCTRLKTLPGAVAQKCIARDQGEIRVLHYYAITIVPY